MQPYDFTEGARVSCGDGKTEILFYEIPEYDNEGVNDGEPFLVCIDIADQDSLPHATLYVRVEDWPAFVQKVNAFEATRLARVAKWQVANSA